MDLKKRFLMNYAMVEEESTARLPKEYQELEYIESTGTQYIKSGVVFTLDDSGEIEADISITTTNDVALFGSVGSYYSPTIFSRENSASYWFSTGSQDVYSPITKNVKHNIKMVGASGTTNWYVDSTNVSTTTYTTSTANSLEMYIFAMNFSNRPYSNASMQLYKFNVKKNGVLVRNFVPCYRKADYEEGLYDLVNDVFYTNQGTGYFSRGDNVYYLPKAYQEVQYIESSGTQYIDTGVNASTGYGKRFNVKLSVNSFDTGLVIGAGKPISGNSRWFAPLGVSHDDRGNLFSMYNGGSYYSTTTNFTTNTIYETESTMQSNLQELKVNGTGEILISTGEWDMGLNLYLFAQNYNGTASAFSSIKLYSCKFYENIGGFHLQNDFRPCYRKSDGEIGLYDCVNDVFYTNQGTGTFAKGENVYYTLPKEYQKVEWIESSGTQYVDTNYVPNEHLQFYIKTQYTDITATNVMGLLYNDNHSSFCIASRSNLTSIICNLKWIKQNAISVNTDVHYYYIGENSLLVDGVSISGLETLSYVAPTESIYLFGRNVGGQVNGTSKEKLYSCKIYDNTTQARVFVPCYRKADNEIGLYDIVNNTFYPNDGTGTFTKGANNYDIIG